MRESYTVIRKFADNYFSVTQLKHKVGVKVKKFDDDFIGPRFSYSIPDLNVINAAQEVTEVEKLNESLIRSRTRMFEISMCNDWEMFATFTIDPKKYDRHNLSAYYKDFSKYINNLNYRHGTEIKYLLVPEGHKDGAWHLHALIMGLPTKYLRHFNLEEKITHYIRKKLKRGFEVFNWLSYSSRFGFCVIEHIRDKEACCKYIVKYITKDLARSVKEVHAKVYYCSQGLNRPVIVYEGDDTEQIALPNFSNVWMERKDFFTFADALEYSNVQFYDSFISSGLDENTIQRIISA